MNPLARAAICILLLAACGTQIQATEGDRQPSAILLPAEQHAASPSTKQHRRRLMQDEVNPSLCPNGIREMALILRWVYQAQFAGYIAAQNQGFYRDKCLKVTIDPGPPPSYGPGLEGTKYDAGIPWFLQWLIAIDSGSKERHVAQIFTNSGWRYIRLPSNNASTLITNFGDLTNEITFAVPRPGLEVVLRALLAKYNKTYCGVNDIRTGVFRECQGGEDIHFKVYGVAIQTALDEGYAFAQGMVYNEVNRLLVQTDGQNFLYTTGDTSAANNIMAYDPAKVDSLSLPEDGVMVSESLWEREGGDSSWSIPAFVEATLRGWIFCRDSPEECVHMIAPNDGNLNQQTAHTLQTMQMNEVNKLIWPAIRGIGTHQFQRMEDALNAGIEIGLLNGSNPALRRYESLVTEDMIERVQQALIDDGIDLYGSDVAPIKVCVGPEGVAIVCPKTDGSQIPLILGLAIGIPLACLIVALTIVYLRSVKLEQKLNELKAQSNIRSLDLEAPIMKVSNLLRKLGETDVKLTPELSEELENVRRVLAQSPNLNMPDISKQLKLLESSAEHSTDLAAFLVDSATYANGSENDADSEGIASRNNSVTHLDSPSPSVSFNSAGAHPNSQTVQVSKQANSQQPNSRITGSFTGKLQALFQMDAATRRATFHTPDSGRVDPRSRTTDDMYNFLVAVHPEADDLLQSVGKDLALDVLTFAGISNSQVLITVVLHIFQSVHNLVHGLNLDHYKLVNFLTALEDGMKEEQYHNRLHAADVVSRLSAILNMTGLYDHANSSPKRELAAALIASIVSVYQHPARTNEFLIRSQSKSAERFNQQHVLQNSAVHKCLKILKDPERNFICNWSVAQQRHFHAIVIELVLGSDVNSHFDLLTRFQIRVMASNEGGVSSQEAGSFLRKQDRATRLLVLQMAMTCAIHGTVLLPLKVHKKWLERLQKEHHSQGDEEQSLGIPTTPLMDREKDGIASMKAQAGWVDIIVLPAFQSFCSTFLECQPLLDRVRDRRIMIGQEAVQSHMSAQMRENKSHRGGMGGMPGFTSYRPSHRSSSLTASSRAHSRTSPLTISPPGSAGPSANDLGGIMSRGQSDTRGRKTLSNTGGLSPSSTISRPPVILWKTASMSAVALSAATRQRSPSLGANKSSPEIEFFRSAPHISHVKSSPHLDLRILETVDDSDSSFSMTKAASLPMEMGAEVIRAATAAAAAEVAPSSIGDTANAEEAVKNNGKAPVASAFQGPVYQLSPTTSAEVAPPAAGDTVKAEEAVKNNGKAPAASTFEGPVYQLPPASSAAVAPSAAGDDANAEEAVKNNGKAPDASAVPGPVQQMSVAPSGSSGSQASLDELIRMFDSAGAKPKPGLTRLGVTTDEDCEVSLRLPGQQSIADHQQQPSVEPPSEESNSI